MLFKISNSTDSFVPASERNIFFSDNVSSAKYLYPNNLPLSAHCPNMNKKSMWEVKNISRFLSTGHGILPSCGCKARETIVAKCELVL